MNSLPTEETSSSFDKFLNDHPNTDFVRVYWLDFSARLRVKVITRMFCQALASNGSYLTAGSNCLNKVVDTSASAGGLKCGTNEIYPDWPTLRPCPHSPGHASVLSTVRHIGDNFECCPRMTLKRMQAKLEELGITTAVGFEIELAIFEGSAEAPQPLEIGTGWLDSAVLRSKYLVVLEEMVGALEASAIPVREFHPESGSQGTFEIILAHREPLLAVDDYVRAQDIIKTIGYTRGLHVTMTPRPFAADDAFAENRITTQGAHAHISITPTVHEEKFMAGILKIYPLLCTFGMASIDSYFRSDDAIEEAAGHWVGWGYQNRYLPVRKVDTGHWEVRHADATANMYMVIATTLAAGLHGIKTDQVMTWKDCQMVPSTMSKQDLEKHCMTTRVPRSLQESSGILETQKAVLAPYIAPAALQAYENVKRKELDVVGKWSLDERRKFYMRVF